MMEHKNIIAVFDSDEKLVKAIGRLQESNIPIKDAYTPFPVHDVLRLLGRESRLPFFSVFAGAAAIALVLAFLYYTAVIDYPVNYGGKPYFAFPSFVVIIYLLTILLTFTTTVLVFHFRSGLYPGKDPEVVLPGTTDDKFVVALGGDEGMDAGMKKEADTILKESGALEIIEN